jgi:epoxyqueuosine reductase
LGTHEARLLDWLAGGFHGEMDYMARHGLKRGRPAELLPGTVRVIAARMDYLPPAAAASWSVLNQPDAGLCVALRPGPGLSQGIATALATAGRTHRRRHRSIRLSGVYRQRPGAGKSAGGEGGLGWIGKHSNLLDRRIGSWFFLGEIYVDLPLPADRSTGTHCGRCTACLEICPTQAIVAPYRVDARRCISYHTIELRGPIPQEFRRAVGNRIYGCDDCQLVCPWNRFAQPSGEPDFRVRHGLDAPRLTELFGWDEAKFLRRTEGSAIRRIGHERWLRNIAVALGNAPRSVAVMTALQNRMAHPSALVREHVAWALLEQESKSVDTNGL